MAKGPLKTGQVLPAAKVRRSGTRAAATGRYVTESTAVRHARTVVVESTTAARRSSAPVVERAGSSEVWQARIGREMAERLRADAEVLGLDGRTDIVRAALELLHRQAAEERMAREVDEFYEGTVPPLPPGVAPVDARA